MVSTLHRILGLALVLLLVGAHGSEASTEEGYNRPTGFHRALRWESSGAMGKGLMFFRSSDQGAIRRTLIETPSGRKLVLTKALLVRQGVDHEELFDEASGWHAELTKQMSFRASSLGDYFSRIYEWSVPGEGKEIALTLRTSTGLTFSGRVPLQSQPSAEHLSFAARVRAAVGNELASEVPEGLNEALAFLYAAFETSGSDSRGLIEVLSTAIGVASDLAESSWRQEESNEIFGAELVDGENVAFASKFRSLDPVTPLPLETLDIYIQEQGEPMPPSP